ncbi:hypothetical protein [Frondihabitans cladoniiphilus]|uniref:Antitoxin VbhA domain-containing protein n=1 Tax=Frondihabitans cladoniiphilus TaxID=715785 RepID=A0ABP8W423_9MICO
MRTDPQIAGIIQLRLDIARELDASFALSLLERARLRLQLITIVDCFNEGRLTAEDAMVRLERLHTEVTSAVIA